MADGGQGNGSEPEMIGTGGGQIESKAQMALLDLERSAQEVAVAAREWGVRPEHLEGRFVTALLTTLSWLGRLIHAAADDAASARRADRALAEMELDALRASVRTSQNVLEQARTALAGSEVQHAKAVSKHVEVLAPQIIEAIREAVVIREIRYNRKVHWGRAFGVAALGGALLLGGFIWGSWTPGDATIEGALALERIRRCQAAPVHDASSKETYCPMSILAPRT